MRRSRRHVRVPHSALWRCCASCCSARCWPSGRTRRTVRVPRRATRPGPAGPESAADRRPPTRLSDEQNQVAEKYRRLEDLIFKMADFEATSNPRRAALLKQAYKQSKDRSTQSQLAAIVALLSQKQYKRALDGQEIAQQGPAGTAATAVERRSLRPAQDRSAADDGDHQGTQTPAAAAARRARPNGGRVPSPRNSPRNKPRSPIARVSWPSNSKRPTPGDRAGWPGSAVAARRKRVKARTAQGIERTADRRSAEGRSAAHRQPADTRQPPGAQAVR